MGKLANLAEAFAVAKVVAASDGLGQSRSLFVRLGIGSELVDNGQGHIPLAVKGCDGNLAWDGSRIVAASEGGIGPFSAL